MCSINKTSINFLLIIVVGAEMSSPQFVLHRPPPPLPKSSNISVGAVCKGVDGRSCCGRLDGRGHYFPRLYVK